VLILIRNIPSAILYHKSNRTFSLSNIVEDWTSSSLIASAGIKISAFLSKTSIQEAKATHRYIDATKRRKQRFFQETLFSSFIPYFVFS
jgi:hypothetical protein